MWSSQKTRMACSTSSREESWGVLFWLSLRNQPLKKSQALACLAQITKATLTLGRSILVVQRIWKTARAPRDTPMFIPMFRLARPTTRRPSTQLLLLIFKITLILPRQICYSTSWGRIPRAQEGIAPKSRRMRASLVYLYTTGISPSICSNTDHKP